MMLLKWNPPPLVPQIEQKDHKPHEGFELDPVESKAEGITEKRRGEIVRTIGIKVTVPDGKVYLGKGGETVRRQAERRGRTRCGRVGRIGRKN